ncbi:hypothetical protein BTHERMOSOX_1903 [Bathymodiolus thermophilus thioautotrophic gill symbiont]|uniref:hypothetical protein n=1 Tax=Bathymodiolus thermophilus thioautotrophic gill symbiont TaxID=2360 RepID=UPI0010B7EC17|nr:hypothetical protein [Bathymodiolus thermophilus thioautotrophic gill symbiont]CAB5502745.1 hypothetical protein THERMOT_1672 [Bathymodiolus thermophilus thioautotrophic gill symbiont]SGZ59214.1 hypothetical protein BTHERMOSOX_1903 [Bathymodiolus thermophilus thioautotrophic gill symbiont]
MFPRYTWEYDAINQQHFLFKLKIYNKDKLSINEWCGSINLQLRLFFEIVNE